VNHALWYASRATGLVSLLLLTTAMVLGLLAAGRYRGGGLPRFAVASLHRNVSLLAVAFLAVHVATAVIDPYAGIGWLDAVLPFVSSYQPFWLGLGAVAADLVVALVMTSLLRQRIRLGVWRAVHLTAYACWPVAVVHGLGISGADSRRLWVLAIDLLCVAAVLGAGAWRWTRVHPDTVARTVGRSTGW
jgi:methionine sulfoxide reductase heme-binding subunit